MSVQVAVARGRVAARRLMTDTCTIRRGSTFVYNPTTRQNVETPGAVVYTGPCRTKATTAASDQEDQVGDAPVSSWPMTVAVPVDATAYAVDDVVTITAVGPMSDPSMIGQRYRVAQVPQGSQLTARRLGCEVYGG